MRGASALASRAGVSPLLIGLTIVALGTSAPEMAISVDASYSGRGDLALGNVVGSSIFNVLLILGLSALVSPLQVASRLVRLDVPLLIAASVLTLVLALDGTLSAWDGALLCIGAVAYTGLLIWKAKTSRDVDVPTDTVTDTIPLGPWTLRTWVGQAALVVVGFACLVLGANGFVAGAVDVAHYFGVSDLIIGLTIVAMGTSLPEVATSVVAALRGEGDIAVGNVVGSNLSNLLVVLGVAGLVAPAGIPVSEGALSFDLPVMVATAVACLPIFFTGRRIDRWEGGLFLGYYVAYTAYLILSATGHETASLLRTAMIWFVLPLTGITLAVVTFRPHQAQPDSASSPS